MTTAARHRLQILAAALLFSTGGAVIKLSALSNWQVACFRSGLAAISLALLMPSWRRKWRWGTLLVGLAYAVTMILYVTGNKLTTAANTIFLQSTAPMYLLLLGPWWLRERIRAADLLLVVTVAAGMTMFFVGADEPLATAPDPFRGNVVAALCGLSWALTLIGLRWLGRRTDGGDSAGAAVLAGNVITFVVCLVPALPVRDGGPVDLGIVVYLGVFQVGLAYVFLTKGVRGISALETSLLLLLEPVLNAFWAWIVHDERPGSWSLAGCSVILVATVARALRSRDGTTPACPESEAQESAR